MFNCVKDLAMTKAFLSFTVARVFLCIPPLKYMIIVYSDSRQLDQVLANQAHIWATFTSKDEVIH